MRDTLGEKHQRRARKRKQFVLMAMVLVVGVGGTGYLFTIDPAESTHPTDIVQGTGVDWEGVQMVFLGPPELVVDWDEVIGQALSCTWVSGWIRNKSDREIVRFDSIFCRARDADGNVIWEVPYMEDAGPFQLNPTEYLDFRVIPICTTETKVFELEIIDAEVSH